MSTFELYFGRAKEYMDAGGYDKKLNALIAKLGTSEPWNEEDYKIYNLLGNEGLMKKIILIMAYLRVTGTNKIEEFLYTLTPEVLDKCRVHEKQRSFLRGMFGRSNYTLAQFNYMRIIFQKIHTQFPVLSPFQ